MGSYFEKELAISGYTKDPAIVMKTIANRYKMCIRDRSYKGSDEPGD